MSRMSSPRATPSWRLALVWVLPVSSTFWILVMVIAESSVVGPVVEGSAIGPETRSPGLVEVAWQARRSVNRAGLEHDDDGRTVIATHRGAGEEVVVASALAQSVEVDLATVIAWKGKRATRVEKRREAELVVKSKRVRGTRRVARSRRETADEIGRALHDELLGSR